jgi:eukaryotic-like serine/threonine-protein kinase
MWGFGWASLRYMDTKIFLGKYRVAADEIGAVGELTDSPLAYEGEEIASVKKVRVETVPAATLKAAVREQLEGEAIAAKKLSHVNIPALCDFGVENDHLVYVTEDFEGTSAEEWVNAHGPMPEGPVLRIAAQVVSALGAAAFYRINHHAINPSNLVLVPGQTAEGEWPLVKVLHFVGVAPGFSGTDVAVAAFDKSLHYASPEQIQKGTVDFRSEIYSLGCTMWFLLTGAPPLVAPVDSTAVQPPKTGLAEEKISAMSKKTRRLLAQMLAVDPNARPVDPLAFYRKLQDCLHRVERRETMARRFGIPSFSPTGAPRRRRVPVKALALAALFLAIATAAVLVMSGYLRHGRIVRAEEPIGKPIGVPQASVSVTPVTQNTNAIASNTAPSTTAIESNSVQSAPLTNAEPPPANAPLPPTESVVSASTRQVEVTPAPPAASDSPKDLQSQEPAPVMANNAATTESREVASNKQTEPAPMESPEAEAAAVAQKTTRKKTVLHEVRRAEPADDEPEVRHAAPAPPEEGPESAARETTASESEPRLAEKSPVKKTERAGKPKRQAKRKTYPRERISESERARPQLPARSGRARLVGVTPEGWWMLELPSNKIIIVPPPPPSP